MYYWFLWYLIPVYWRIVDSQVTSFQYTEVLLILMWPHNIPAYWCVIDSYMTSFPKTDVLLILMWPHSSILMCYWFSCDLIPAHWSIVDSQVPLFQQNDVLLILMWPHSSIMCYWFSWYLIPVYQSSNLATSPTVLASKIGGGLLKYHKWEDRRACVSN